MNAVANDFWSECDLVERVPGKVSGAPVVVGSRVPADTLVENVEAFMEFRGLSQEKAIAETAKLFPTTTGGAETIRKLLAYQEAHLRHPQP